MQVCSEGVVSSPHTSQALQAYTLSGIYNGTYEASFEFSNARFGVPVWCILFNCIQNISKWINIMSHRLCHLIFWPNRDALMETMPICF